MSGANPRYNFPTNLYLSRVAPDLGSNTPAQVKSAIDELYTSLNNLAASLIPYAGITPRNFEDWPLLSGDPSTILASNMSRLYVKASETIAYGDIISLTNVAGDLRVRLANATNNTRPADGFCSTTTGIAIGAVGEVILAHGVLPASGLTIGQRYYLSTVNGIMSNVPAVAAGNIEQYLGVAISTTAMYFNSGYWIQH